MSTSKPTHTQIKLSTREYVLNAFLNHDIAFINRLEGFTIQEVDYLASRNSVYLLTLIYLNKLTCDNVSEECREKILDLSVRLEFPKGVAFYLTCQLMTNTSIDDALTRIATFYPDMFLNLHNYIQLPILSIPNVNMGTINTLKAIRGDGTHNTAEHVSFALREWINKRMWKGEVGKALLEHHIQLSGGVYPFDHPTFDDTDVRVMYLKNVIPNITENGKLTDVLLLEDRGYTARCMAGFELIKVKLETIELMDYDTRTIRAVQVSPFAVGSLLCMFSDAAILAQDFEGMLLWFLMHGYISSARHLLHHHPQHIRPFVEKYHRTSHGCNVMYKRSYQLFLEYSTNINLAWSMIKTCDNAVFTKMFFAHFPEARVDLADLVNHPTLFNHLNKSERKRLARNPKFVAFANECLAIGYRVPIEYIDKKHINSIAALKSGELDLIKRHLNKNETLIQLLPFIPSQTIALLLDEGIIKRESMREISDTFNQSSNVFRVAYYQSLEF